MAYDRAASSLVLAWKEQGLRRSATLAAELVAEVVAPPRADAVTFVPADRERLLKRGHHPAERLARELGERWERPVLKLLERTDARPRQRDLPLHRRRRNVRGTFRPTGSAPPGILLVDDVYTSGATAAEAASALHRGGARRVHVVTFARAVR